MKKSFLAILAAMIVILGFAFVVQADANPDPGYTLLYQSDWKLAGDHTLGCPPCEHYLRESFSPYYEVGHDWNDWNGYWELEVRTKCDTADGWNSENVDVSVGKISDPPTVPWREYQVFDTSVGGGPSVIDWDFLFHTPNYGDQSSEYFDIFVITPSWETHNGADRCQFRFAYYAES